MAGRNTEDNMYNPKPKHYEDIDVETGDYRDIDLFRMDIYNGAETSDEWIIYA
jgi:hypothetical protein